VREGVREGTGKVESEEIVRRKREERKDVRESNIPSSRITAMEQKK